MPDKFNAEKRSWVMSRVHNCDTSIEVKVRKWLFHKGYRYRKNVKQLPGKPDIVLNGYKTVIFVQGCFWHRHPGCKRASTPQTRTAYWNEKFAMNQKRDIENSQKLEKMGYRVIVLWECEIEKCFDDVMNNVAKALGEPISNKH